MKKVRGPRPRGGAGHRQRLPDLVIGLALIKQAGHLQPAAFLEDLCTVQELRSMARRLQVASLLYQGQTYDQIRQALPVSSATITRISTELQFGQGGYQTVLERLEGEKTAQKP